MSTSNPRHVSVTLDANIDRYVGAMTRAGVVASDTSEKIRQSAADAGAAQAAAAAKAGSAMEEQARIAAASAAETTRAYANMTAVQKAAGDAAAAAAAKAGASIQEQRLAMERAIAVQREFDAGQVAGAAIAAKVAEEQAASAAALADQQAKVAARVDQVKGKMAGLGATTSSLFGQMTKFGTIGLGASVAGMVDLASKFETSTHTIAANSGISIAAANKIGAAFLANSAKTVFSGKEMADAYAGVAGQMRSTEGRALSAAQALTVMQNAGDLAEATNTDLGTATSTLSAIMQAYGLRVNQAQMATDVLYNASKTLNMPIDTLETAIEKLHARLGPLAPSLREVGGLVVQMSSYGLQGTRGVTEIGAAMQTLVGQSSKANKALADLGVHVYDNHGKFIGLQSVIAQLQPKFMAMNQEQQDLAAKTLFGARAAELMLQIIRAGPAAYQQATLDAGKLGSAHAAAQAQTQTLNKQLDILRAALENAATQIGMHLLPALTSMTEALSNGVQWLERHKTAAEALGIAIGTVLATAVTVFAYQKAVAFTTAVGEMSTAVQRAVGSMVGNFRSVGPAADTMSSDVKAADAAVVASADETSMAVKGALMTTGIGAILVALGFAAERLSSRWSQVMTNMKNAVNVMVKAAESALNALISVLNDAISLFNSTIGQLTGALGKVGKVSQSNVFNTNAPDNSAAFSGGMDLAPNVLKSQKAAIAQGANPAVIQWAHDAALAGAKYGVNPALLLADMNQESGGTPIHATGSTPGLGNLTQFLPGTAAEYGVHFGTTSADTLSQIMGQADYLAHLGVHKNVFAALEGYNSGRAGNPVSAGYARSVMSMVHEYAPLFTGGHAITALAPHISAAAHVAGRIAPVHLPSIGGGLGALSNLLSAAKKVKVPKVPTAIQTGAVGQSINTAIAHYQTAGRVALAQHDPELARIDADTVAQLQALGQKLDPMAAAAKTSAELAAVKVLLHTDLLKIEDENKVQTATLKENQKQAKAEGTLDTKQAKAAASAEKKADAAQAKAAKAAEAANLKQAEFYQRQGELVAEAEIKAVNASIKAQQQAFTKAQTAANADILAYQNEAQTGSPSILERRLGVATGGIYQRGYTLAGRYNTKLASSAHGGIHEQLPATPTETVANAIAAAVHGLGPSTSLGTITSRLTPILQAGTKGTAANASYQHELQQLYATGQDKEAKALVAAHKQAMAALAEELYAAQTTRDADVLNNQVAYLRDQTTAINDWSQNTQTIMKAEQQKVSDAYSAIVQHMADMQQITDDAMSGMATAVKDATTISKDYSQRVIDAINDQTQIQVDQIGERGLYGLNLIAQQLQVQADEVKAFWDQQIDLAQQQLDTLQQQADAQENAAQVDLDIVTAQQNLLVAQSQANLDNVTIMQDQRIASAQAKADAVQAHADATLIGPAQIALDVNANAPRSVQQAYQSQVNLATAQAGYQTASAQYVFAQVQADAQNLIAQAQGSYTETAGAAQAAIQQAGDNLKTLTDNFNLALAQANQNLQLAQSQAQIQEAQAQQAVSTEQAKASTEFAGGGLVVNLYGIPADNAASIGNEVSWAARGMGINTA